MSVRSVTNIKWINASWNITFHEGGAESAGCLWHESKDLAVLQLLRDTCVQYIIFQRIFQRTSGRSRVFRWVFLVSVGADLVDTTFASDVALDILNDLEK